MKDRDPRSTRLGKRLSKLIGRKLDDALLRREKELQLPVEVNVEGIPELLCRKVFFVNLLPWDEQDSKAAVQVAWRVSVLTYLRLPPLFVVLFGISISININKWSSNMSGLTNGIKGCILSLSFLYYNDCDCLQNHHHISIQPKMSNICVACVHYPQNLFFFTFIPSRL